MKEKINVYQKIHQNRDQYIGNPGMGSLTLLTFSQYIDSARGIMFSSHSRQRKVILGTEFPRVFTNYENMVGDNSSYNVRAKAELEVIAIIEKFHKSEAMPNTDVGPKLVFVYDRENNMYDVIERRDVEDLTEKYGFSYDTSGIDSYNVGDTIPKGAKLYAPTSYDYAGNYGFGKNVKFMYAIDNDTIEDAIVVSERLAKSMLSVESEEVNVSINDNDFLINLYGDENNYKAFPNIGEKIVDKRLCVKRRINNQQILFDFKASNTTKILPSDSSTYVDGEIVDLDIWCNKPMEEIADTVFNEQLLYYLNSSQRYYTEIRDLTGKLIRSGIPCSQRIKAHHKRAEEITSGEYKVKDEANSVFANIVLQFQVKRISGLYKGQKLTGRYGNKGVISVIKPDYLMPRIRTGEHTSEQVDIIFNTLGPYNRLNIFQGYEQSITFVGDQLVNKMKTMDLNSTEDLKEMEKMVFTMLEIFNKDYADKIHQTFKKYNKTKALKKEFFQSLIDEGIHIHIEPFWHKENIYESVKKCYEVFDWLEPYEVFFFDPVSKRWVRMINKQVIGSMYIMVLKQNSKKGLSACSTAPINKKGLPEKTDSAKKHKSVVQPTPVRFGIQETINDMISIPGETLAKIHALYRSMPKGRRALGTALIENYGEGKPVEVDLNEKMTNRNVEILNARLNMMGLQLRSTQDEVYLPDGSEQDNMLHFHSFNGIPYICTPNDIKRVVAKDIATRMVENNSVIAIDGSGMDRNEFMDQVIDQVSSMVEEEMDESSDLKEFVVERYNEFD